MLIQLYKGTVENAIPALTAETTTSVAKHSKGHNALIVFANITGTGAWTIKIQGATSKNGTYLDLYITISHAIELSELKYNADKNWIHGMWKRSRDVSDRLSMREC